MLASGGYRWTSVPLERRTGYIAALEAASVDQDIKPFSMFLAALIRGGIDALRVTASTWYRSIVRGSENSKATSRRK